MSLPFFRSRLMMQLLKGENAYKPPHAGLTLEMVDTWFDAYKKWEAADTFSAAFKEKRMTVRQSSKSQTYDKSFNARQQRGDGTVSPARYPGHKYAVGLDSLKMRLDPKNLEVTSNLDKGKYIHGLHDLSGSLLDPDKPTITEQLRWKELQNVSEGVKGKLDNWFVVFMPMAAPEDLQIFYLLNSTSKKLRGVSPEIYHRVREIRQRMSRVKLAEENDMACGLIDIALNGPPKLRYGIKDPPDARGQLGQVDQERRRKALHYTSILAVQKEKGSLSNEIVIAYREHAGNRFPIIAQWDKQQRAFACLAGEASSNTVRGGLVYDDWAKTIQA